MDIMKEQLIMDTKVKNAVSPRVSFFAPAFFIRSTATRIPITMDKTTMGAYNEIGGLCISILLLKKRRVPVQY